MTTSEQRLKQMKFAELLWLGNSYIECYRNAYGSKANNRTCANKGYKIANYPRVKAEVERLHKLEDDRRLHTKQALQANIANLADMMLVDGLNKQGKLTASAAGVILKAYELNARLDGHFKASEESSGSHLENLQKALKLKKDD